MKHQLYFAIAICNLFLINGLQGQKTLEFATFNEAKQAATVQHKPLMVMLYADWCEHCKKMKQEVLPTPDISTLLKTRFAAVAINAEKEGVPLAKQYMVNQYPTFLFFNEQNELIYGFMGEFNAADFQKECQQALVPEAQFTTLKKRFEQNTKQAQYCLDYVMALRKIRFQYGKPAQQYLAQVPDNELLSEIHWKIIANGIMAISSREIQFVLKNQAAFAKIASPKRVERKLVNVVQEALFPLTEQGDTLRYSAVRAQVKAMNYAKADSLGFEMDCQLYEKVGNWKKYKTITLENTEKWALKNPQLLKRIVGNYAENITDGQALKQAESWAIQLKTAQPNKENYKNLGKIYLKLKQFDQALVTFNEGITTLKDMHFDPSELERLLLEVPR
jgi:thioredoxin-related protein